MVDYLKPHLKSGVDFDLYWNVGKCTLDMICATSMGSDYNFQGPDGDEFMEAAEPLAEIINQRMFNVFYHSSLIYKLSPLYRLEKKLFHSFRSISRKIIGNANEKILPKAKLPPNTDKSELRKPCIFIEQLYKMLSNIEGFSEAMLKDHVDTIIAAVNIFLNLKLRLL